MNKLSKEYLENLSKEFLGNMKYISEFTRKLVFTTNEPSYHEKDNSYYSQQSCFYQLDNSTCPICSIGMIYESILVQEEVRKIYKADF